MKVNNPNRPKVFQGCYGSSNDYWVFINKNNIRHAIVGFKSPTEEKLLYFPKDKEISNEEIDDYFQKKGEFWADAYYLINPNQIQIIKD